MPFLLVLWIALTGYNINEDYTLDVRMSASDCVLPLLTLLALLLVRKQQMPFAPPRAKPWILLVMWINAIAIIVGAWRVGFTTISTVVSSLFGVIIGYTIVCAVYSVLSNRESVERTILVFVVAGSIWNLVNLVPYLASGGGHGRLSGTILNAGGTGMFASAVWICQVAYLMNAERSAWHLLGILNVLLLSATIMFSGARGTWIAIAFVLPLMLVPFASARARATGLLLVFLLVMSGALMWPLLDAGGWLDPVKERFDYERGLTPRVITTSRALELWASSPITMLFGIGTGAYRLQYAFVEGGAGSIHNTYVELLVSQGPIALIGWLAVVLVALHRVWLLRRSTPPHQRWLISALSFTLVALLIQGVPRDITRQRLLWLFVGTAFALADKGRRAEVSAFTYRGAAMPARQSSSVTDFVHDRDSRSSADRRAP